MTDFNAYFGDAGRSPYELGRLLRDLPEDLTTGLVDLTESQLAKLEAAEQHAGNQTDTLLTGLDSLGHLMWSAGRNERHPVGAEHFSNLGLFVAELAVQMQFLNDFRVEANMCLHGIKRKGGCHE